MRFEWAKAGHAAAAAHRERYLSSAVEITRDVCGAIVTCRFPPCFSTSLV
jgi:hypothetical protein